MSFNRYLSALVGTASTVALMYGQPALAQQTAQSDQPAASSATGLEEVVVTARRREEKAQTVPITITTFTQKSLEEQNIRTANDLDKDVPSIQLCCNRGSVSFAWLRGVPGVLGYFNQLPASLNGSSMYYDLASLQVLKGPQGTLFGVSTNGGAILFESKKPTNSYEGYVQLGAGNYGHVEAEGTINVPVVPDKLLVRAGGQFETTDGFVHDLKNNRDLYDETYGLGRVSVTFLPTDNIKNDLVVDFYRSHNHGTAFVWDAVNPAGVSLLIFNNPTRTFTGINGQTQFGFINAFNQQLQLGKYEILGSDASGSTYANTSQWNINNTTSWDINDNITIKNIAGYQEIVSAGRTDTDGTPFNILDGNTLVTTGPFAGTVLPTTQPTPNTQYTEELQVLGKIFNDHLTYTFGTFNQIQALRSPHIPGYSSTAGSVGGNAGIVYSSARADAIYAQGTYDLSDFVEGLSFTGGYRYNWDKKEFHQEAFSPTTQLRTSTVGYVGHWHAPTFTIGLDYQWRPSTLFYITDSRGYTTGGFNVNGPAGLVSYAPEQLMSTEIGVKSDWEVSGVKLRTNVSAYYGSYNNVQTQLPVAVTPTVFQVLTTNAATAHIEGIETELTILPTESIELHINAAYNIAKYDTYLVATPAGILNNNNTPFTEDPKWNWNIHGTYHLPIDASYGDVSITAAWSYQTRESTTPTLPRLPTYDVQPFGQVDMSMDWRDILGRTGLSGTIYGTNIFGNVLTNGPFQVYSALGIFGPAPAAPPMFGVRLRYEFGGATESAAAATTAYVPPAPAPVQPAAPKSYLVFFDFDKSDLTSAGRQIVDQAAMNAPAAKVTQIEVTGHTDTVGSDEYNMRLSKRRAMSVAAELEAHGVPQSEIDIVAKGKRDPLVPTGDGVREPQNRRVEIVYGGAAS